MSDNEFVIGVKIKVSGGLKYSEIPKILEACVQNGEAEILTAESYEHWKEEQENK
jgi:hypothetical protein